MIGVLPSILKPAAAAIGARLLAPILEGHRQVSTRRGLEATVGWLTLLLVLFIFQEVVEPFADIVVSSVGWKRRHCIKADGSFTGKRKVWQTVGERQSC